MPDVDTEVRSRDNGKKTESKKFERGYEPHPFTLKEIRDSIPAHCFERNYLHSMAYVAHDLFFVGLLFYLATWIPSIPLLPVRMIAWVVYWISQGIVMVGPWIIAHECGHGGFSPSTTLNNIVGWTLHSALLVPYYSWKISHGKHHKGTGSMERDVVFVPSTRSDRAKIHHYSSMFEDAPILTLIQLVTSMILGWFLYLFIDMCGPNKKSWVSHFHAPNELFEKKHSKDVLKSIIGVVLMITLLTFVSHKTSFLTVMMFYGIPYLQVNTWIAAITYLHHTQESVPHFREAEWSFARGAAATVDRTGYGWIINHFHHHIGDTHVAHHLFSQMPFYHAQEATQHLKKFLGKWYIEDHTPIHMSLWNSWRDCVFVENEGDVVFYKSTKQF